MQNAALPQASINTHTHKSQENGRYMVLLNDPGATLRFCVSKGPQSSAWERVLGPLAVVEKGAEHSGAEHVAMRFGVQVASRPNVHCLSRVEPW